MVIMFRSFVATMFSFTTYFRMHSALDVLCKGKETSQIRFDSRGVSLFWEMCL